LAGENNKIGKSFACKLNLINLEKAFANFIYCVCLAKRTPMPHGKASPIINFTGFNQIKNHGIRPQEILETIGQYDSAYISRPHFAGRAGRARTQYITGAKAYHAQ
jgi:hypothetical protein